MLSSSERSKRYRRAVRLRRRLGTALSDAGRLPAWLEDDREAIREAVDILLDEWAKTVTSDGVDPVRRVRPSVDR